MDSTAMMLRQMGGVNLDIDATFFIQLAVIVLTMIVLRKLVFQPYLRVAAIREELTTKTAERAEETSAKARELAQAFESKLQAAKQEALELKGALRAEGVRAKDEVISQATTQANSELTAAREKLSHDIGAVRAASQGMVDDLAGSIVSKILGRSTESFSAPNVSVDMENEEEAQP